MKMEDDYVAGWLDRSLVECEQVTTIKMLTATLANGSVFISDSNVDRDAYKISPN